MKADYDNPTGPPQNSKFTLLEIKRHHTILKNALEFPIATSKVVESVRVLAELVIYSENHSGNPQIFLIFEYFIEQNVFHLLFVLVQAAMTAPSILQQVLQTLAMIFQNIKKEIHLYLLFSNPSFPLFLQENYPLDNEEVSALLVTLLKVLSAHLSTETLPFFLVSSSEFPLFDRSLTLLTHQERMVCNAAKTILLSVLSLESNFSLEYIFSFNFNGQTIQPNLLDNLSYLVQKDCILLDEKSKNVSLTDRKNGLVHALEDQLDDTTELFFFLSDVLENIRVQEYKQLVRNEFLSRILDDFIFQRVENLSVAVLFCLSCLLKEFSDELFVVSIMKRILSGNPSFLDACLKNAETETISLWVLYLLHVSVVLMKDEDIHLKESANRTIKEYHKTHHNTLPDKFKQVFNKDLHNKQTLKRFKVGFELLI
eukprot:maker-scaffold_11-snap-gene-8.41-mRNA-1 protein AED:0.10 eAED:0.10 QI:70/1/1/1/1/1/2/28/426